jgi:hypothetical protein
MNTNPDDERLALWLDDELAGEDFAHYERASLEKPERIAQREETRAWKTWIAQTIPAAEEPPHAEFFNARILRIIERQRTETPTPAAPSVSSSSRRAWLMPAAAAAGILLGFQLGAHHQATEIVDIDVSGAPKAIPVEPILYTPEKGVRASWFTSHGADAYVIVLDGVPPIPDTVDFTKSMSWQHGGDHEGDMADAAPSTGAQEEGGL